MINNLDWITRRFELFKDQIFLVHNDISYTYSDLLIEISKVKDFISGKINKGEIIALLSDYSFLSISLFFGLIENKNIIVPISISVEDEIKSRLDEAFCDKVITITNNQIEIKSIDSSKVKHNLLIQLTGNGNSGLVLFSSGITGKPKAMLHNMDNLLKVYKEKKINNLSFIVFLMFDHIGGLNTMLDCIFSGSTMIIPENRSPEYICQLISRYKVKVLPVSPTFLNLIYIGHVYEKHDLSSLELITYGAEPMPENLLVKLQQVMPHVKFLQKFGTSETGVLRTSSKSSTTTLMKIHDKNQEYKIVDGELWIRSQTQILGYLNASMERFTEDGWYNTGDLTEITDDGFIRITGRKSEIINIGGEKVMPSEIENILLNIPFISECMVYGEKNLITGQSLSADIVLNQILDKKEARQKIREFCKNLLSNFKIPTKINFVDKIEFNERYKRLKKL